MDGIFRSIKTSSVFKLPQVGSREGPFIKTESSAY